MLVEQTIIYVQIYNLVIYQKYNDSMQSACLVASPVVKSFKFPFEGIRLTVITYPEKENPKDFNFKQLHFCCDSFINYHIMSNFLKVLFFVLFDKQNINSLEL
jgi:hypothetical protein